MSPGTRKWITGLVSAVAGGSLTALTNMGIAPETFNFSSMEGVKKLGTVVLVAVVITVLNYIKQYPAPVEDNPK